MKKDSTALSRNPPLRLIFAASVHLGRVEPNPGRKRHVTSNSYPVFRQVFRRPGMIRLAEIVIENRLGPDLPALRQLFVFSY